MEGRGQVREVREEARRPVLENGGLTQAQEWGRKSGQMQERGL